MPTNMLTATNRKSDRRSSARSIKKADAGIWTLDVYRSGFESSQGRTAGYSNEPTTIADKVVMSANRRNRRLWDVAGSGAVALRAACRNQDLCTASVCGSQVKLRRCRNCSASWLIGAARARGSAPPARRASGVAPRSPIGGRVSSNRHVLRAASSEGTLRHH
jgi:hypothetical protein